MMKGHFLNQIVITKFQTSDLKCLIEMIGNKSTATIVFFPLYQISLQLQYRPGQCHWYCNSLKKGHFRVFHKEHTL